MAASTKHIETNLSRMAGDDELLKLWNHHAKTKNGDGTERTIQQAWVALVQVADEAEIADRVPGTVGRTFKAQYADERKAASSTTVVEVDGTKVAETRRTTAKPAAKKTTTRKTTTKAAAK